MNIEKFNSLPPIESDAQAQADLQTVIDDCDNWADWIDEEPSNGFESMSILLNSVLDFYSKRIGGD